jgi:oligopeptidase B
MKRHVVLLCLAFSIACSRTTPKLEITVQPPVAAKIPHETVLHGQKLVDNYHWLRQKGSPEVNAYLTAETRTPMRS